MKYLFTDRDKKKKRREILKINNRKSLNYYNRLGIQSGFDIIIF